MRPSELAYNLNTIIIDLDVNDVIDTIVISVLGNYENNFFLKDNRRVVIETLTNLNQKVFSYKMKDEYKDIITMFGFQDYISLEITNDLINYLYTKTDVNSIMADRYALASFQKLVTFLNTMSNANNALTKFILVDKKLPLETEESRFQFIIPHEEGGHNIEDIIKVYTSLNKIYRDLTKLDGKESDLKIVYVESGSEILTELKGIIEIISMMYFLYKLFENKDRERTHNQIADIKEAYEFKDWVEERVKKGKISPEDAKYLIDDIAYNVKQLRGIDLDFDKSEIILPQQLPQTTESKNDDDISKIKE